MSKTEEINQSLLMDNLELKEKSCVVVIPAFNEELSIAQVINDIPKENVRQIIVVNNNSTDDTAKIAEENGALVVHEAQLGYGKACLTGIAKALEFEPEVICFLDGDYSDNPKDLVLLLDELKKGNDLVIGSRTLGKAESGALLPQAIFGNWLSTRLMKICFGGYPFTDLGPFRVIRTKSLMQLKMKDEDFGWTVEMQSKALIHGLKCSEVSVSYKKRIGVSKITGTIKGTFLAGYKILGTIGYLFIKNLLKVQSTNSH